MRQKAKRKIEIIDNFLSNASITKTANNIGIDQAAVYRHWQSLGLDKSLSVEEVLKIRQRVVDEEVDKLITPLQKTYFFLKEKVERFDRLHEIYKESQKNDDSSATFDEQKDYFFYTRSVEKIDDWREKMKETKKEKQ